MKFKQYSFLMTKARCKMPVNLQLFADGGDDPAAGSGGGGSDPDGGSSGSGDPVGTSGEDAGKGVGKDKPMSFDEFLKGEGNQAEFDRRMQKAIDTAVSKAKEKWDTLANDKATEAKKLEKMNAEEKAEYQRQKRIKELDDREAEITRRELMATAKNTLADKGLPQELSEILVYTDAEACNKSIEAVTKAFSNAVEAAVKERLKGTEPMKKAGGNETPEEIMKKQIQEAVAKGWS